MVFSVGGNNYYATHNRSKTGDNPFDNSFTADYFQGFISTKPEVLTACENDAGGFHYYIERA